jgi:outer membrane protein TolC
MLGLLHACTAYHPAPIDPEYSANQFAARRLEDPRLRTDVANLMPQADSSWPPQQWDRGELLAIAMARNSELVVARAQLQSARAQEVTARQWLNPDMTLQSEYGARGEPHPWLYGVAFDYVLQSPARRRLEQHVAGLAVETARLQLMDRIWSLRRELVTALSDWESAKRRLALLDQLASVQDRGLMLERRRIDAGEDSSNELVLVEQARIQTEQQQAQSRLAASVARAAAAKELGVPPAALDGVKLDWPEWGAPPPITDEDVRALKDRALRSRADLGAAMSDYSIAEDRFKLAVKRQYPQLIVGPGYYWDHGISKFPLDLGFSLPFNGNRGEIAEARAAREVAGAHMLSLQADILGQIASAERAEQLARAAADTAERRLENAQRQATQRDLGQRLGESDVFEGVETETLTIRAGLEVLEMRSQWQAARNQLEDALHSPLSGPELAIANSADAINRGAGS